MKRNYADLANSLARGVWTHEFDGDFNAATKERMDTAALIDIMCSLRRIVQLLECQNIANGLKSMQKLEALAREFWVPRRKKRLKRKELAS